MGVSGVWRPGPDGVLNRACSGRSLTRVVSEQRCSGRAASSTSPRPGGRGPAKGRPRLPVLGDRPWCLEKVFESPSRYLECLTGVEPGNALAWVQGDGSLVKVRGAFLGMLCFHSRRALWGMPVRPVSYGPTSGTSSRPGCRGASRRRCGRSGASRSGLRA